MYKSNPFNISIILILAISVLSCGADNREVNSDQLQRRGDGNFYVVNEDEPFSGKALDHFNNGQNSKEMTINKGKLSRTIEWHSNGQKKSDVSFAEGLKSGPYREWHKNGQLKEEGSFALFEQEGGQTVCLEDGPYQSWYNNGQLNKKGTYKGGKRDGHWVTWYSNGQEEEEANYHDGEKTGSYKKWDVNGQLETTGVYENGALKIDWDVFFANLPGDSSLVTVGNENMYKGQYNIAIECYKRALEQNPKDVQVIIDLGTCCSALNQNQEAIVYFKKALEYEPANHTAMYNLGMTYYNLGESDQALVLWNDLLAKMPPPHLKEQVQSMIKKVKQN